MELGKLQCDTILKQKYTKEGILEFETFVSQERFLKLLFFATRINAMFGATYIYE